MYLFSSEVAEPLCSAAALVTEQLSKCKELWLVQTQRRGREAGGGGKEEFVMVD